MAIILKNVSGSSTNWGGISIANNTSYTLQEVDRDRLLSDSDFLIALSDSQAIINNGTVDLNSTDGLKYLRFTAIDGYFDNSINGYTAKNVQAAIEESKATAVGKARFTIVTTFNSTVGANNWLGYNELLPGNVTPIRIPVSCTLKEITFSWNGAAVDGQYKLYKNGTAEINVVYTSPAITNIANGVIFSGLNINFVNGDYYIGRWVDTGDNPSDMAVVYFFQTI